jgi:hypothetical protein
MAGLPQRGTTRSVLVRFVDGVLGAGPESPVAISSASLLLFRSASAAGAGRGASRACTEARTGEALSSEIEPMVTRSGSTVVVETLGREITRALHTHTDPAQTTPTMTRAGTSFRWGVRIGLGAVIIGEMLNEVDGP